MAEIISGTEISKQIKAELQDEVTALKSKGVTPCLATILVGEDEASNVYIGQKVKTCDKLGIVSLHNHLPADVSEKELLALVERLNNDNNIHGILCQLPLPKHLNADKVLLTISPEKDVDGFHLLNMGKLLSKKSMKEIEEEKMYLPCTPHGIIQLLRRSNININGAEAVIVGRSNIVGKPAALLLMAENATVTICHSNTRNIGEVTRRADILIAAIGKPKFVTADMVKDGVVVIDVGVNRLPVPSEPAHEGTASGSRSDTTVSPPIREGLCGDVDFEKVKEKAKAITPVPGGVGPMTIAMLMVNTVKAAKKLSSSRFC